ncbi:CBS domain-containing protein [Sporomusa aerivorans]|uniref:CBS domain-containing protein n=1 Tax=Sporomusa aerivorans TaxID=204936 RepID=UPI00352A82B6
MNIAFFLIPKNEVVYMPLNSTMRQALERMEYHRYTAVPLIDELGKYAGTITEGDFLWKVKNTPGLTFFDTERILIKDIPRRMTNNPVHINSQIQDLLSLAIAQNFVPVVDDSGIFIGIVRRREIIEYYAQLIKNSSSHELLTDSHD